MHLEPDLVAARLDGRFHVVEIKSFPVIDGQADPAKVAAAAIQSAVYVLALRELLAAAGQDPELVSHEVVLVCPRDFANQPVASLLDVRKQLLVLRRQLDRMARIDDLLDAAAGGLQPRPGRRPGATLAAALSRVRGPLRAGLPGRLRAGVLLPARGARAHRRAGPPGPRGAGRHRPRWPRCWRWPPASAAPDAGAGGGRRAAARRGPAARRRPSPEAPA